MRIKFTCRWSLTTLTYYNNLFHNISFINDMAQMYIHFFKYNDAKTLDIFKEITLLERLPIDI